MLLPSVPKGQEDDGLPEEEEDPRAELVRRLLEYQKYRAAALDLAERGTLGRDVFGRGISEPVPEGPAPFASLGVFSLLSAFEKILKRSHIRIDHEVVFDRISITDRIVEITERLMARKAMRFEDLLLDSKEDAAPSRFEVVITFLAILEMCRLRVIRVYQSDPLAPLHLELAVQEAANVAPDDATPPGGVDPEPVPVDAEPQIVAEQSPPATPVEEQPLPVAAVQEVSEESRSAGEGVQEVDHGG
jgi:segregation and condensation protein A